MATGYYGGGNFGGGYYEGGFFGAGAAVVAETPAVSPPPTLGGGGRVAPSGRLRGLFVRRGFAIRGGRGGGGGGGGSRAERAVEEVVAKALGEPPPEAEEAHAPDATPTEIKAVAYRLFTSPVLAPLQADDEAKRLMAEALALYEGNRLRQFLMAAPVPGFDSDEDELALLLMMT